MIPLNGMYMDQEGKGECNNGKDQTDDENSIG